VWNKIQSENAVVLGVSPDDEASHQKFAKKYRIPFTLLSDPGKKVMEKYGAWGEKRMYGKKTVGVIRSTVWVGPDGKVRKHWRKVAKPAEHADKVLEALQKES
jgi:peroxiredoxin Q/BCP